MRKKEGFWKWYGKAIAEDLSRLKRVLTKQLRGLTAPKITPNELMYGGIVVGFFGAIMFVVASVAYIVIWVVAPSETLIVIPNEPVSSLDFFSCFAFISLIAHVSGATAFYYGQYLDEGDNDEET